MVGSSSLKVKVEIFIEQMYSDHRELAVVGEFTMVAINDEKKAEAIKLD
jgi:acyl-CoA hydrolase